MEFLWLKHVYKPCFGFLNILCIGISGLTLMTQVMWEKYAFTCSTIPTHILAYILIPGHSCSKVFLR